MALPTVLIVEDDATLLRGLSDNFRAHDYHVITATGGRQGLDAALLGLPDLIVLDIMLPEINGYELCRLVRRQGLEMPIIMLTVRGQEEDIVRGLELGADDYVTKPFSIRELLARRGRFCGGGRRARTRSTVLASANSIWPRTSSVAEAWRRC